jgi:L-rhamnose-H+ transport protein
MCGIFSAGMSFAMNAAKPMHDAAAALGVDPLYTALPSYVVIMGGGALVNLGFCFIRLAKVKNLSSKPISRWPNRSSSATCCFPPSAA